MNGIPFKMKHWKLAITLSAILSLFGVVTNNIPQSELDYPSILAGWFLSFSFLLIAWFQNSIITNLFFFGYKKWSLLSKILIVFFANVLLLLFFIFLSVLISKAFNLEREYNYVYLIVRGSMSIAIIYLIQFTLNLNARNQAVLLQNQMLKTENIRAQFEMLRQQISPHFLFNSLSSLRSMIRSSNQYAEEFVIKLSDIYRLLLANKETEAITLKEELAFIDDYSFLLFARYEDMINLDVDIPDSILASMIPTFTLQLLLENCVKHNIVSREYPLSIKIFYSGLNRITVENNLQARSIDRDSSGIGLQNLTRRYELLGINDGVQLFSDESVYRVTVRLLD